MFKHQILQRIINHRMVAIVRANSADAALKTAEACFAGGMTVLEIALTTPSALTVIATLKQRHGDQLLLGAGTVLDAETAVLAVQAGAQFILSPSLNIDTIRACNRHQVVAIPGAMTPTEIMAALEAGADIVKVFPCDALGSNYIKAVRAPLPAAPLMPTGGITLENMADWFAQGALAVGIGGSLTAGAAKGDYAAVEVLARQFVARAAERY